MKMTQRISDLTPGNAARIAGLGYLIIFISGIFANFFVLESLIVPESPAGTIENIMANQLLFRVGIFSFMIMVIFDILLAWLLYILLKPVNTKLSLFSGWLRLVNGTIFGIALYHLLNVLEIVGGADYIKMLDPGQLQAQVLLFLHSFNQLWLIGLVFFGLHLLVDPFVHEFFERVAAVF